MGCVDLGVTLDGRPTDGAPVLEPLEHSVLEMTLDGGPVEGMPVLEPLEHSVLEMALGGELIEDMSVLEPLEHSVLDVALVRGYCSLIKMIVSDPLEHPGLGVTDNVDMDGGPLEEMSKLEPLEHSVRNGRPMVGISVLEPLEHSVPDVALVRGDCSLIKMTVSDPLEHSGLGVTDNVDLDGGPLEELSKLEPLEHSVLSVALDGRPMEGIPVLEPLEHSVLEMALDGRLMEGDVSFAGVARLDPVEHSGVVKRMETISAYIQAGSSAIVVDPGGRTALPGDGGPKLGQDVRDDDLELGPKILTE